MTRTAYRAAPESRCNLAMTSDLDIYRSANLLVKQHGRDAPIHAAMRADAMLVVRF